MFTMKQVLLVVLAVALVCVTAGVASATDDSWLISIKGADPVSFGGGGAVKVGVGTTSDVHGSWPAIPGLTKAGESTLAYGDAPGEVHVRHDVLRDTMGTEEYSWDLMIGSDAYYEPDTINICIWNNGTALIGAGGELNHYLAYAFYRGDSLLAWFSDATLKTHFTDYRTEMVAGKWTDVTQIIKNSSSWSPGITDTGFYITDTVTKSATGSLADMGAYRFEAFGLPVPEPGSLLALGSGLLGAAGLAWRRRRA